MLQHLKLIFPTVIFKTFCRLTAVEIEFIAFTCFSRTQWYPTFSRVKAHMIFKVAPFFKHLTTGAFWQFLTRMRLDMSFQIYFFCVSLFTLKTLERPFSSVNSRVDIKGSFMSETLFTQRAGERLLSVVNPHVDFKASFPSETISTLLAGKRLLSGVNSHVVCKTSFFSETYSTLLACERLLSGVNSHVTLEVSFMCESLSTLMTQKRLLSNVSYYMPFKAFHVFETHFAQMT